MPLILRLKLCKDKENVFYEGEDVGSGCIAISWTGKNVYRNYVCLSVCRGVLSGMN